MHGQGLPCAPTVWTQTREWEMEVSVHTDLQEAGVRLNGPIPSRQQGNRTQQLQEPWSQDQERQKILGAKGPHPST